MTEFKTRNISLNRDDNNNRLKVSRLCELINVHPYKDKIYNHFGIESIENDYILIDNIMDVFLAVEQLLKINNRFKVTAESKNVNITEEAIPDEPDSKKIYFSFDEYVDSDGVVQENLKAEAIYGAKNSFFDEFGMTKYANHLLKIGLPSLVKFNTDYFKELAKNSEKYNKTKSYRLVERDGDNFLRGITTERYNEYGVDFTFVVAMLVLHKQMKSNTGLNYQIKSCWVSESKLELIVADKAHKTIDHFGNVSTAIKISTNDLGQGSMNFTNILNVHSNEGAGFYLYPRHSRKIENGKLIVSHTTKPTNVFILLKKINNALDTSDEFISNLKDIKSIQTPDEIRVKILSRIESPRSSLRDIKKLSDIFKRKISNEISQIVELFNMCNKAEELELDFDLKDKLRYIISDYVLYGRLQ